MKNQNPITSSKRNLCAFPLLPWVASYCNSLIVEWFKISVNTFQAFNQIYNFAEMQKYFQYKLDGTDKSALHSLQHQIQNDDRFSELQEKDSVNF